MTRVTIAGWEEGLNKVQLNRLLRQYAGLGLSEAKHAVDELLSGMSVTFEATDPDSATAFCLAAKVAGAVCSPVREPQESV